MYNVYGSQNEFLECVTRVFILRMRSLGHNGPLRRNTIFAVARIVTSIPERLLQFFFFYILVVYLEVNSIVCLCKFLIIKIKFDSHLSLPCRMAATHEEPYVISPTSASLTSSQTPSQTPSKQVVRVESVPLPQSIEAKRETLDTDQVIKSSKTTH